MELRLRPLRLDDEEEARAAHAELAWEILRQSLVIARAEGVDRVPVICDEPNVASATVIERSGGVLEDVRADELGTRMARYWIA